MTARTPEVGSGTRTGSALPVVEVEEVERILFVTRSSGNGGAEKHLADLIERLDPSLFEVVLLTMGLDPLAARLPRGRGSRIRVMPGPGTGRFAESWSVFRSARPDFIVFIDNELGVFHWQMYLAARLSGARRVVTIEHLIAPDVELQGPVSRGKVGSEGLLPDRLSSFLRRKLTTRLPGLVCHATLCVSDAVRDRLVLEYGYPTTKTITKHNGVDLKYFARDARSWATPQVLVGREAASVVVCVAQLVAQKRIDLLIQAMKAVVTRYPESLCVIVGGGALEEQLRSMVSELGMENKVLLAGRTDDVRPYLAAGDIFVLPSEREGLPLALLEAMAFGLPCVAAEAGGNREAIEDGVSGFVVPSGSSEALADAIERLVGDPEARIRMGRNARRIAEEKFDIEKSMARVQSGILGRASVA